jgi:hypothetical protein
MWKCSWDWIFWVCGLGGDEDRLDHDVGLVLDMDMVVVYCTVLSCTAFSVEVGTLEYMWVGS